MADELAIHRSADSLSVHKARLARPKINYEEEEEEDEQQPDSPAADSEVQARIDSIALAQRRMEAAKKGGHSSLRSGDSGTKAPKTRFGGPKARFPDEDAKTTAKQPTASTPESAHKKSKVTSGVISLGKKLAERLSFGRKEAKQVKPTEDEAELVEGSDPSTHVKFAAAPAELIPAISMPVAVEETAA